MVKIEYGNFLRFEEDYFDKISASVLFRLSCLRKSIAHLLGEKIVGLKESFDEYSTVTRKIVNYVETKNIDKKEFSMGSYSTTVYNYISNKN